MWLSQTKHFCGCAQNGRRFSSTHWQTSQPFFTLEGRYHIQRSEITGIGIWSLQDKLPTFSWYFSYLTLSFIYLCCCNLYEKYLWNNLYPQLSIYVSKLKRSADAEMSQELNGTRRNGGTKGIREEVGHRGVPQESKFGIICQPYRLWWNVYISIHCRIFLWGVGGEQNTKT